MRLFFDARYIRWDFHDGISRFSTELAAAVAEKSSGTDIEVTFLVSDARQLELLPTGAHTIPFHSPTSWREPFAALRLNKHRPDVVFSPMQTIGSMGRKFRLILTLHDTIYYRHRTPPRSLPALVRFGWRLYHLTAIPQRITLNAADIVATVSETSKKQFAAMRLTKRQVVVIPNGPRDLAELLPDNSAPVHTGKPRNLVYMGSFMAYKNVETLVRAMKRLPGRTLHLLSRIAPKRRAELESRLSPGGGDVRFHDGVSDAEYAALLARDAVLVTTTFDEGYGLPVAEALALGVPAVVSDLEILREVAGDGATYVPATDDEALARAIADLDDDALRAAQIERGRAHIARYSWTGSAQILLDAVRGLA